MSRTSFGLIWYSYVDSYAEYETVTENYEFLFSHLTNTELLKSVYFVDDSPQQYQESLRQDLGEYVETYVEGSVDIFEVTGNENIYEAVNNVWRRVNDDYVISHLDDHRAIADIPLAKIKDAFEEHSRLYLLHLRVRGLFGYNDRQASLRDQYPWYGEYDESVQEIWYCQCNGKVYSIPCQQLDQHKDIPKRLRGVQLVPRPISEQSAIWTPVLPARFLPSNPYHEQFSGGPAIYKTNIVEQFFPLHEMFDGKDAAYCLETYIREYTTIDYRYYTGYLDLRGFVFQYNDPDRPLQNYEDEYLDAFYQNNCVPVTDQRQDKTSNLPQKTRFAILGLCRLPIHMAKAKAKILKNHTLPSITSAVSDCVTH